MLSTNSGKRFPLVANAYNYSVNEFLAIYCIINNLRLLGVWFLHCSIPLCAETEAQTREP